MPAKKMTFSHISDERIREMFAQYKDEIVKKHLSKQYKRIAQMEAYELFAELHRMGVMLGFYCTLAADFNPKDDYLSGHLYVSHSETTKGAKIFPFHEGFYHDVAVDVINHFEQHLIANNHDRRGL